MPIGNYVFQAETGGRRQYGRTSSNTLTVAVLEGIPLLFYSSQTVPDDPWFPNTTVVNTLTVQSDPAFTQTGVVIQNTLNVSLVQGFPPQWQDRLYDKY